MILSPPSSPTPSDSYIYRLERLFVSTPLPRFLADLICFLSPLKPQCLRFMGRVLLHKSASRGWTTFVSSKGYRAPAWARHSLVARESRPSRVLGMLSVEGATRRELSVLKMLSLGSCGERAPGSS